MVWTQEEEELYMEGNTTIIDKCYDLVEGGCMYDGEHIAVRLEETDKKDAVIIIKHDQLDKS